MNKNVVKSKKTASVKSPKLKDRKASEEKLLKAAELIFAKYGFQGTTTRMIAEKADVNLALINRYFDGKYGLLLKIIELKAQECIGLEYAPKDNLVDELNAYCEMQTRQFYEGLSLFRIILVQYITDPKFLKKFKEIAEIFQNNQLLENRIEKLIKDKKVSPHFPYKQFIETLDDMRFGKIVGTTLIFNAPINELLEKQFEFIKLFAEQYDLSKKG